VRRGRQLTLGVGGVVLVAVAVVTGLAVTDGVQFPGVESDAPPDGPVATTRPPDPLQVEPPPELVLPRPRPAPAVLAAARGPLADARAVRAVLRPMLVDPDLGGHVGVVVRDLARDRAVLTAGDPDPYVPASTLKLFTAAAALAQLGPDHRFTTSVRLDPAGRDVVPRVVLVGGGDPLLATRPPNPGEADVAMTVSVARLAADSARALRQRGVRRVRVGYDAGLFIGPAAAPSWAPDYVRADIVSPVSALWVDEGRIAPDSAERSADPALAAAGAFAEALRRAGVRVDGEPQAGTARARADVLTEAAGAQLDSVVEHVLQVSDNEGAEVLLRHVALATDRPASFTGGVSGVREVLTGLGVPYAGVRTYDGSGLSRANRITLAALAQVLQLGADPAQPALRTVTAGLPVARFNGSLAYRFLSLDAAAGRGLVRAKTGTLSRVHGLAGTVVTRNGTLLGFGLLTDDVQLPDTLDARALLDEMAAALAGCGCRR